MYITDGNTEFYIYSVNLTDAGAFTKGDTVIICGYVMNYQNSDGTTVLEFTSMTVDGSKVYPEAISVTKHEHNYSQGACDATSVCSVCDGVKGDHAYDNGVETTAPTCLAAGVTTYTCVCSATKTEPITQLEHSYTGEGGVCVNGCGKTSGEAPAIQYNKVTSASEFTTGTYVITVNNTIAFGVYDNGWGTANTVSLNGDAIDKSVGDATALTITVTVKDGVVTATIKDKNGAFIAPKAGNSNGMRNMEYSWKVIFNEDGTITFAGQGDDTTYLAYNTSSQYMKFRGYKTTTCNDTEAYYSSFTAYKLVEA